MVYLVISLLALEISYLPSIFLMALRIFLIHSSQCKPTFTSTTWWQKIQEKV